MRSIIRLFKGAGILNLLGMTVAFAAIYIIMVQVNYDWNYNSKIKDLDRIFIMAYKDWYEEGKYSVNISRPIAESILKQSSIVESYTVIQPHGNSSAKIKKGDETRKVEMNITEVTSKAFNLFGFEAIAGTFDGMNKEKTVAISEKTAKKFNLKPGDIIWIDTYTKLNEQRTVTAIYKGMPTNSLFGNIDLIYCDMLETENIENYSEWSYKYYVKLNSSESIEDSNDNINKIAKSVLQKITDENTAEQSTEEEYIDEHAVRLFPLDGLQFNNIVSDNFTSYQCNKTTTVTLFVVSILILVITLINYLNFFMAQIPVKLRSVNTKKNLGSSRLSLVTGFIIESAILVIVSLIGIYYYKGYRKFYICRTYKLSVEYRGECKHCCFNIMRGFDNDNFGKSVSGNVYNLIFSGIGFKKYNGYCTQGKIFQIHSCRFSVHNLNYFHNVCCFHKDTV